MSEVGIQMCNGITESSVSGLNPLMTLCQCCPYGYHIDRDFVRFCEMMAKNSGEPSPAKRQRRERRRQRQSMEVLLGLANPVIWNIEQLLPPIIQEHSPHETEHVSLDMSSFTNDNDGLKKAVMDFEATLERTSKRKQKFADSKSLERCRPDHRSIISKTNEFFQTNSSPQHSSFIDLDLANSSSNRNSSASPLQNIREQMAISLESMRELEDRVKIIPNLEYELHNLKSQNSFLQSKLEEMKQKLVTAEHYMQQLEQPSENEREAFSCNRKPLMTDAGIMCYTMTRDVGTVPVSKKLRSVAIGTLSEVNSVVKIDKWNNTDPVLYNTVKTQVQPQTDDKSTATDLCMKDVQVSDKEKRLSLLDLKEKSNKSVQTFVKESFNFLQVIEKREAGVQAIESKSTRETGIIAKPKYFDVSLDARPRMREIGVSYDKITDLLCDRCKDLKTRTVGIGNGDIRTREESTEVISVPERSKSFHFTDNTGQKLTRNIAVGTVTPVRKLTSSKYVDTQDFSATRIKHAGMNTTSMKLVDIGVGSDHVLSSAVTYICAKCDGDSKPSKPTNLNKENRNTQQRELQPSKIPRPKSLNTTPIMERKKFFRQDTYTKSLGCSPTDSFKKLKQRVNLSPDNKSEAPVEEKVLVKLRNKSTSEETTAETEKLHKELKDLHLSESNENYNRSFDDYCYEYDENYGDQDSKRNSQLFPDNVLFLPIQDEPREKMKPSKEMKAAMKVVHDSLNKYPGGLPRHLKNASNIIQQEWFKISSTASANPLDVEDYLDSFEEVSSTLLEYIVNMVDNNGNTAMHYAVSHGNFDVVSILLDSKVCNINKPNAAGYTCIMLVSLAQVRSETHRQVVRRLFQLADVNVRAKQHGQTALMLAVSHGRLDMVKLLLEAGADPNIQDGDGSTALMCAAEHGHTEIVKHILAHPDCDPSIVDCDGSNALAIAMEAGNRDIGVLLYAREHFTSGSRGSSPYTSLRQRRNKTSNSPHSRTPTSPNPHRRSDHSV